MSDDDSDRNPETGLLPLWQVGPDLDRITYSHDATVAAIKDYYEFLTKMCVECAERSKSQANVFLLGT